MGFSGRKILWHFLSLACFALLGWFSLYLETWSFSRAQVGRLFLVEARPAVFCVEARPRIWTGIWDRFPLRELWQQRQEIREATICSAAIRERGQWNQRTLTLCGPCDKLQAARKMALEKVELNGDEGGSFFLCRRPTCRRPAPLKAGTGGATGMKVASHNTLLGPQPQPCQLLAPRWKQGKDVGLIST